MIKWLINTLIIDPLLYLFLWNVIISAMFNTGKTTFGACLIFSIITGIFWAGVKSNLD